MSFFLSSSRKIKSLNIYINKFYCVRCITTKPPPYNILFFGTDLYALASLKKLYQEAKLINDLQVVCVPEKRKRKWPVKTFALENHIPVHTWGKVPELKPADLGVVVSFGKMMPRKLIESFEYGMVNVHGSLLPNYRGGAPISRAIEAGDTSTGVTVFKIAPHKFDVGDILATSDVIPIDDDVTSEQLNAKMAEIGAQLLIETIADLPGKLASATPQKRSSVTEVARRITIADTYIDFNKLRSIEVWNKYRAFGHSREFPLRCALDGELIRLTEFTKPDMTDLPSNEIPGSVVYDKSKKSLLISCMEGAIECTKLTLKRPITPSDFNNSQISRRKKIGQNCVFEPVADFSTDFKKLKSN